MAKSWSVNIPNPVSNVTVRWPHEKLSPALFQWKVENSHHADFYFLSLFSNIVMCQNVINITAITILGIGDRVATRYNFLCTHQLETGLKFYPCQNHAQVVFFFLFWSFQNVFQMSFLTWLWPWMLIAALQCWMYVYVRKKMEWLQSPLASLLPFSVSYRLYICKSYVNWKLSQQAIQDFVLCSVFPLYLIGLTSLHKHHVWTQWQKSLTKQHSSEAFNGTFFCTINHENPTFLLVGLS